MKIFHIDLNSAALNQATLRSMLDEAAKNGFEYILWEVENKIQWQSCPECVAKEAMTIAEFKALLEYARSLNLKAIPLLQTFGHAEYVLQKPQYYQLRELPDFYDCYCPSKPELSELLKKWIEEYLQVFGQVEYFHLGGDEAYHVGKCPKCSQRNLLELYCEHLRRVTAPLLSRNIRPCIWHDVVSGKAWWRQGDKNGKVTLDPRFVVWYWDYQSDAFGDAEQIAQLGFDQILCAASQSFGDDPFLVNYQMHLANIESLHDTAKRLNVFGECLTSWSVRMGLKELQYPLLAAFAGHQVDNAAELIAAGKWDRSYFWLNGIMWSGCKDDLLPPANYLATQLAKHAGEIPAMVTALQTIEAQLPAMSGIFAKAIDLKREYLQYCRQILQGKIPTVAELTKLRQHAGQFYQIEQMPLSGANNAAIVINPLLDYCRNAGK